MQKCTQKRPMTKDLGAAVRLRHPLGEDGLITFDEPCPTVAWTGNLLSRQCFSTADVEDGVLTARAVVPPQQS